MQQLWGVRVSKVLELGKLLHFAARVQGFGVRETGFRVLPPTGSKFRGLNRFWNLAELQRLELSCFRLRSSNGVVSELTLVQLHETSQPDPKS